jgi:acyl dehydratase
MIDKKWIGHQLPSSEVTLERGKMQFFAQSIGEKNPVYSDVAAAQGAGYPDLLAPPTFLFDPGLYILELLDVPVSRVLHGEQTFKYFKNVYAGETLTFKPFIKDIYDKKNGALEFITKATEVFNQKGELVAELSTVIVVRNA